MSDTQSKPQLNLDDQFTFACHKGLDCYTSCCRDVNIMLTPNDVLRMKRALGMTSGEFMAKHTQIIQIPGRVMPLVQLKMNAEDNHKCYFVREQGCLIYEHRPWACRMFPLDEHGQGGFVVVAKPEKCHGLLKGNDWKVRDWLKDQGATQSKEADGSFESLVSHQFMRQLAGEIQNEKVQQMLLMALYDLDRFREFVLNSSFLDRFDLDQDRIDAIKTEEVALLDLAYDWVRFGLLGHKSLKVKESEEKRMKASQTKGGVH